MTRPCFAGLFSYRPCPQQHKKAWDDRPHLWDEIEKIGHLVGIGDVFTYSPTDHNGLTNTAFVMIQIQKGQWTLVKK
jgi:branched-chain amino acid transport system substrate-binding protein